MFDQTTQTLDPHDFTDWLGDKEVIGEGSYLTLPAPAAE